MTDTNNLVTPETPTFISYRTADLLARRIVRPDEKPREAQVRNDFIQSRDGENPPPMTQILRGGRGGEVKLKLYLSMLWVAVAKPFDVTEPARVWAQLIGLEDASGNGAARVNAAIRKLIADNYLHAEKRPGLPTRVFLREETGSGAEYTKPSDYWIGSAKPAKGPDLRPRYTRVPAELWTNGWITKIGGPALAMFLALLQQSRTGSSREVWFSPSVAARRYGLTEVTRSKGLRQLNELGLIETHRRPVGQQALGTIRMRNTYVINEMILGTRADDVPTLTHLRELGPSVSDLDLFIESLSDGGKAVKG